ncbi:MAG: ChrR family anti-sigma-E factor [Gammaproteobacteria bacterium]|nr:ChrR family anti-sigma-E factor [Gammaproteobacteria bacterium]
MNAATPSSAGDVSHHLADDTLSAYSAGSLNQAMETLIACHLTVCPYCRSRANAADGIGGAMLHESEHLSMQSNANQVLTLAMSQPKFGPKMESVEPEPGIPMPLTRLLGKPLAELDWKRMAPGIKQINLSDQPRKHGAFKLLHLDPGVVLSQHSHTERELTYVVKGSYQDEIGRFKAGDIADLDDNNIHQPVVDTDEPCIALIATDSPVRFTGVVPRLLQPFVGL